jgi:hypothetical protein
LLPSVNKIKGHESTLLNKQWPPNTHVDACDLNEYSILLVASQYCNQNNGNVAEEIYIEINLVLTDEKKT